MLTGSASKVLKRALCSSIRILIGCTILMLPARAAEDAAQAATPEAALSSVEAKMDVILHKYYPKAKVTRTKNAMHFQFKIKQYDIPQTNTVEWGPEWSGILGDIEVKDGRLNDDDTLERKLNQYSYYSVIELKPNSTKGAYHLKTRLSYPFDVQPNFLQDFKNLIRNFESTTAAPAE